MTYYLPSTTEKVLRDYAHECKNLGLLLDKYPPKSAIQDSRGKSEWLKKEVVLNNHIDFTLVRNAYRRWFDMTIAMGAQHFNATLEGRMVIGFGGSTVLETDLTLHHLYGVPYISGSALKGLTRTYVANEEEDYYIQSDNASDGRVPSKDHETDHEHIIEIFGSQKQAGTVIFFDAMPLDGKVNFAIDIMNPHYPDYYGQRKPPTNDQDPTPVSFLAVMNTTFTFALAPRQQNKEEHLRHLEQVIPWAQKALQKYGIGGKTSAGYGFFKKDN